MPLVKLGNGLWKYGYVTVITREKLEDMKKWKVKDAITAGIPRTTFNRWKDKNFQETQQFLIIDDPPIVEKIPQIEAKKYGRSFLVNEDNWKKFEPYIGRNYFFARLLYENSSIKDQEGSHIPMGSFISWMGGATTPVIVPLIDYDKIYSRLSTTEDQETLKMSASLGLLFGGGNFEKMSLTKIWESGTEQIVLANCTGLLPKPLNTGYPKGHVYIDPNYTDFLERRGFLNWRTEKHGSFIIPAEVPHSLFGHNKNTFLAQSLEPALYSSSGDYNVLEFQLRSKGRQEDFNQIIICLLNELDALPSKAFIAQKDEPKIKKILKSKGVIIYTYNYDEEGTRISYPPSGIRNSYFDFETNAIRLKNLVENVISYAFHLERDYKRIHNFVSSISSYTEDNPYATSTQILLKKAVDAHGIRFPDLLLKEFTYQQLNYKIRMPIWYQ